MIPKQLLCVPACVCNIPCPHVCICVRACTRVCIGIIICLFSNINEDKRKMEKQMLLFEVVKEIEDCPVS